MNIPIELLDKIIYISLPESSRKILWTMVKKADSVGEEKEFYMSYPEIMNITNLKKSTVAFGIKDLIKRNIIIRTQKPLARYCASYKINYDLGSWKNISWDGNDNNIRKVVPIELLPLIYDEEKNNPDIIYIVNGRFKYRLIKGDMNIVMPIVENLVKDERIDKNKLIECLKVIASWDYYKFNAMKDIKFMSKLLLKYPHRDIIDTLNSINNYMDKNPTRKNGNIRLTILNWVKSKKRN
jgi:hypothetical protein